MNISNLIKELKRRNVFKVATAYAIAGWLIIQIATSVFPAFEFPTWTTQFVIILVLIGFPISLIISWAFELTPDGLKTTKEVDESESITSNTGKKLNGLIIGALSVLVVFLVIERIFFAGSVISEEAIPISTVSDKSIAVLPFDDFNAGGDQEYFADGLTEEILNSLAKAPDLLVASRTSSFQYKDKNIDVVRIADTLGVAHILEGSIRASSDKYRITAQLIRASDGFHLWSETYDRPKTDIIDIQEEIAFEIATALETAMDPEALRDMLEVGTSSIEAYKAYIEGLSIKNKDFVNNKKVAYDLFELARSEDPEFSAAHFESALMLFNDMNLTSMASLTFPYGYQEKLLMVDERLNKAIQTRKETDRLKYLGYQALTNLELRKGTDYLGQYSQSRPSESAIYPDLIYSLSMLGDYETAKKFHAQYLEYTLENQAEVPTAVAFYFWTGNTENADPWMQEKLDEYPYSESLAYQAHRIMLWNGEVERANEIKSRLKGLELPEENFAISDLRQACAENNNELATKIYEDRIIGWDLGAVWISLMTLDRKEEAYELLKEMDARNELHYMKAWLYYQYFDYTRFPNLTAMLEAENHSRGPVVEIPFRCGR
jgi:TolB-like protein